LAGARDSVGDGAAQEGSARREPWGKMPRRQEPARGDTFSRVRGFLSPFRGSDFQYPGPRLTPWATFSRCSAAICRLFQWPICGPRTRR